MEGNTVRREELATSPVGPLAKYVKHVTQIETNLLKPKNKKVPRKSSEIFY